VDYPNGFGLWREHRAKLLRAVESHQRTRPLAYDTLGEIRPCRVPPGVAERRRGWSGKRFEFPRRKTYPLLLVDCQRAVRRGLKMRFAAGAGPGGGRARRAIPQRRSPWRASCIPT
jgi:hypothetical protein